MTDGLHRQSFYLLQYLTQSVPEAPLHISQASLLPTHLHSDSKVKLPGLLQLMLSINPPVSHVPPSSIPLLHSSTDPKYSMPYSQMPKQASAWSPEDDKRLRYLKEQQNLGWRDVANHFPFRTPNACQFRWRRIVSASRAPVKTKKYPPKKASLNYVLNI